MRFDRQVFYTVFSAAFLAFIGLTSMLFYVVALGIRLATALFDRRRVATNLFSAFWASVYTWCMPVWSVHITGRDKLSLSGNYVLVSNHQSQLDILVLYRLLYPYRWVSKAEVFGLPFIGWNMVLNGDIPLRRGNKASVAAMMARCDKLLRENVSVFFFPEGTRSRDGKVGPFKPGAFILAKNTGTPIQPIVITGTRNALPKHTLTVGRYQKMAVRVLDTIPYERFAGMTPEETADMVRGEITAHLG